MIPKNNTQKIIYRKKKPWKIAVAVFKFYCCLQGTDIDSNPANRDGFEKGGLLNLSVYLKDLQTKKLPPAPESWCASRLRKL